MKLLYEYVSKQVIILKVVCALNIHYRIISQKHGIELHNLFNRQFLKLIIFETSKYFFYIQETFIIPRANSIDYLKRLRF